MFLLPWQVGEPAAEQCLQKAPYKQLTPANGLQLTTLGSLLILSRADL
jgi:hypothetical protein